MSQRVPSFSPYWNDWENDFSTMYNTDWNAFDFKNQKIVGQDFQVNMIFFTYFTDDVTVA